MVLYYFLIHKKRDHNEIGWTYIGIAIKYYTMKVGLASEYIAITEGWDIYEWILRAQAVLESRWKISDITLIFADQFVTQKLLVQLDIERVCVLRCDYYHLTNEVWPKLENIGHVIINSIVKYLRRMLISADEKEWNSFISTIECIIFSDLEKLKNSTRSYLTIHTTQVILFVKLKATFWC